jgi:hypothetical protein
MAVRQICQAEIPLNIVMTAVVNFYEGGLFNDSALGVIRPTASECVLGRLNRFDFEIFEKLTFVYRFIMDSSTQSTPRNLPGFPVGLTRTLYRTACLGEINI